MQHVLDVVLFNARVHIIKNRFSPDYDAKDTYGYRDLSLQLSLHELEGTLHDGFVSELQMHLKCISQLKQDSGHKLYVQLRNLVGT